MPRNRRPRDAEAKRNEILDAATELFTQHGYEGTSLKAIATSAGVTANTIYWYFPDKDALLVGVADRLVQGALTELSALDDEPLHAQLLWVVHRLRDHHQLVTAVHARADISAPIDTWHRRFHDLADAILKEGFKQAGTPEPDLDAKAQMAVLVVEGLITHIQDDDHTRAILGLLAS
jgi:AcrR family transcriptional regulator